MRALTAQTQCMIMFLLTVAAYGYVLAPPEISLGCKWFSNIMLMVMGLVPVLECVAGAAMEL